MSNHIDVACLSEREKAILEDFKTLKTGIDKDGNNVVRTGINVVTGEETWEKVGSKIPYTVDTHYSPHDGIIIEDIHEPE